MTSSSSSSPLDVFEVLQQMVHTFTPGLFMYVQCSQTQDFLGARLELLPDERDTKSLSDSCNESGHEAL